MCLLLACKTTKQTAKADVKINEAANTETRVTSSGKQQAEINTQIADKGRVNEITEELSTTTVFTLPDTAGKQYPAQQTTTKRTTRRNDDRNVNTVTESKQTADSETIASKKNEIKTNASVNAKTNEKTEIKAPQWMLLGVILGVVGLLFLVFLVLKRYKIL